MKATDFIKLHISGDDNTTTDKKFLFIVEQYKKYAYYLDLLCKDDVKIIFYQLIKNDIICKHKLISEIRKYKFDYYINILLNEKLIKHCDYNECLENELKGILGKYNFEKMAFYCLTKKGKDLISNKNVEKYLK